MPVTEPQIEVRPCAHCGLPSPPAEGLAFCCDGCRTVHGLLAERGLKGYYALAEGEERQPARGSDRTYEEFDAEAFADRWVERLPGGRCAVEVYLEGVHCRACVWLVEKLPRLVPGALGARLDLGRAIARLTWDPAVTSLAALARTIDSLGYRVHPARDRTNRSHRRSEDREALIRLTVAGALAGNVMLISFALYGGALSSMEPAYTALFRWAALLLTIPAVLGPGRVFLRGAWASLKTRTPHMDLPVALALTIGLLWGAWNTVRGAGEVYFDTVSVLVFLLLVGRWVQQKQRRAAADATGLLQALAPASARVALGEEPDAGTRVVPLDALAAGDVVEVWPGEVIPADGAVLSGRSHLDTSLLTGESRRTRVGPGDLVYAGTLNHTETLRLRADTTGSSTRLGRLLQQVEAAQSERSPIVRWADRVAGVFVAAVLTLAAMTLVGWLLIDPSQAVDNAVALLIITCPCALGLATPLAISAAVGRAARRGVLIKDADALQQLAGSGRLWLDKTGTLTEGEVELLEWHGPERAKALALALEEGSPHPLARGLRAGLAGVAPAVLDSPPERVGGGVRGLVESRPVLIGSPACLARAGVEVSSWGLPLLDDLLALGRTPVLVAEHGVLLAVAGCGDPVRPEAANVIASLRRAGWQVGILSGDHPEVVAAVARELGVTDARGGLLPEDKLAIIQAGEGRTVMVGDGINDAAALAAATTGIGVHGSSEATLVAADVFLARPGLAGLEDVMGIARRTLRVIRLNLAISLAYNVIGAALAVAGVISPLVAAVLMPLSSLAVVGNSYRSQGDPWKSSS